MRRWLVVAGLAIALSSFVFAQSTQKGGEQNAKVEEELLKLEREWLDAEARGDVTTLNRLFADDFIGSGFGNAILSKEDVIPREDTGANRLPKSSLKEATVRVFGDTAVVMGRVAAEDPNQPTQFRFTKVYIKRQNSWQVVAAHLSR